MEWGRYRENICIYVVFKGLVQVNGIAVEFIFRVCQSNSGDLIRVAMRAVEYRRVECVSDVVRNLRIQIGKVA